MRANCVNADPVNPSKKLRLRRTEASVYLKENHDIERAPSTLAKYAVTGSGPRYQLAGKIPLYPTEELDRWAASIISPLKSSTSEYVEVQQ